MLKKIINSILTHHFYRYGQIDHYLSNLVPNGIVKIKNGNSMKQFGLKIQKNYMQEMIKQLSEMMVSKL